jgi:Stigma-specific protein, Stig1
MRNAHYFLAFPLLLLAACYSPNIPNGMQKCSGNACAAGYECGPDGLCYKKGQVPSAKPDLSATADLAMACTQADCKAPTPVCDPDSKQCVPCLTDTHCPDGKLCKSKQCVPGCSMAHGCGDAGACDPNGMCQVCTKDGDCQGNTPRCDTDSGRCVACLPLNDNCTNGLFCKKVNSDYTCVMGCKADNECMNGGKCCNNVCVDLQSDGMNCGACGKSCNGQGCCAGSCTDTMGDIANCGACGKACTGGHAMWQCAMGACGITGCQGSYKDCNMDPMDGCESNTAADPMNCTACGMKCNLPNAVAGCANGCFVQSCNMGFGNCNNNPADGCEANLAIDKANCGTCGKVCANVPNGFPGCANSTCIVGGCIAGFDDCDLQVPNGCESKVDSDPNNCGMCGKVCPLPPNATAACTNNVCGLGMCNAGFGNCDNMAANGCEKNLNTDPAACGGCGKVCSNANIANPTCAAGTCNGNCNAGFGDCNNNKLTDGCELNLTNNANNCGLCGKVCPNGQSCAASMCQAFVCNPVCLAGTICIGNNLCGTPPHAVGTFGPVHTFGGLQSSWYISTGQGSCSVNGQAATDAQYFCQHFYGPNCNVQNGYMQGTTVGPNQMHKNSGCTSSGNDIANTICDTNTAPGMACKMWPIAAGYGGLTNLVCVCQ